LRTAPALPRAHATMPLGHDLAAMAQLIDATTRLVFIANPNNPTGSLLPRDDLRRFLASVPADCGIVLDEAYFEYARHSGGSDGVVWLTEFPNLVVVRTFSKAFGLAGLRIGYAVSDPAIADMLNRVRQAFNVSHVGQTAAAAAWQDRAHLERSVASVTAGAAQLQRGFAQLGLAVIPSAGNFLLVEFGPAAMAVYHGLLREGVIVRPVGSYGLPDFLRITIGTETQNARLLAGLAKVLASLRR
jgi:histidinol-phosphate aminotransferase